MCKFCDRIADCQGYPGKAESNYTAYTAYCAVHVGIDSIRDPEQHTQTRMSGCTDGWLMEI